MQDFGDAGRGVRGGALKDGVKFVGAGEADFELEEKAVELRFGQRIRSFLVNRILGRHDEKRLDELSQFATRGDLVFLHRFQQSGLGLRRCPVDFVRQNEVRKNRPSLKLELSPPAGGFHDQVRAEDVRRHQVGRELNATERKIEHIAQRPN